MKRTPFFYIVLISFIANTLGIAPTASAIEFRLPVPGVMVRLSPEYNPPILKGIKVHPENPFRFDFILDQGDGTDRHPERSEGSQEEQLKEESTKLIKYFLASLTIPEKDLWVNLSPYEKKRIIPQSFGQTEMGRDLLAEDYMLKQITASLVYPEDAIGKKFWKRIYAEASKKFGTTSIPVNTFNKVWIVPEKAVVYENTKAGTAYVVESKLKVMLEQDYLALEKNIVKQKNTVKQKNPVILSEAKDLKTSYDSSVTPQNDVSTLGSQVLREIIIPELNKEVNEGKNFAQLRQVYNSLILATWYKKKIRDSILAQVYEDRKKVAGILSSPNLSVGDPEQIYQRYLKAFKKGAYNYIKEETDPMTQQSIPRKYFSGGVGFNDEGTNLKGIAGTLEVINEAMGVGDSDQNPTEVDVNLKNAAMSDAVDSYQSLGERKKQEDVFLINEDFKLEDFISLGSISSLKEIPNRNGHIMAVIDGASRSGQGGEIIASHAQKELINYFGQQMVNYRGNIEGVLKGTMSRLAALTRDYTASATVTIVYVPHDSKKIYYAVLGDCPLFVINKNGSYEMAPMHNLENFDTNPEVVRIQKYFNREEGFVAPQGIAVGQFPKLKSSKTPRALGAVELGRVISKVPEVGVLQTEIDDVKTLVLGSDGILEGEDTLSKVSIQRLVEKVKSGKSAKEIINEIDGKNGDNKTLILWHPEERGQVEDWDGSMSVNTGNKAMRVVHLDSEKVERDIRDFVNKILEDPNHFDINKSGKQVAVEHGYSYAWFGQSFQSIYDEARQEYNASLKRFGYGMSPEGFVMLLMRLLGFKETLQMTYLKEIDDFVTKYSDLITQRDVPLNRKEIEYLLGYRTNEFFEFYFHLWDLKKQGVQLDQDAVKNESIRYLKAAAGDELIYFISRFISRPDLGQPDWNKPVEEIAHENEYYNPYFASFLNVLMTQYSLKDELKNPDQNWNAIIKGVAGNESFMQEVGASSDSLTKQRVILHQMLSGMSESLNDLDLKNAGSLLKEIESARPEVVEGMMPAIAIQKERYLRLRDQYSLAGDEAIILRNQNNEEHFEKARVEGSWITSKLLKANFKVLGKKYHPDVQAGLPLAERVGPARAGEIMSEINAAKDELDKEILEKQERDDARSARFEVLIRGQRYVQMLKFFSLDNPADLFRQHGELTFEDKVRFMENFGVYRAVAGKEKDADPLNRIERVSNSEVFRSLEAKLRKYIPESEVDPYVAELRKVEENLAPLETGIPKSWDSLDDQQKIMAALYNNEVLNAIRNGALAASPYVLTTVLNDLVSKLRKTEEVIKDEDLLKIFASQISADSDPEIRRIYMRAIYFGDYFELARRKNVKLRIRVAFPIDAAHDGTMEIDEQRFIINGQDGLLITKPTEAIEKSILMKSRKIGVRYLMDGLAIFPVGLMSKLPNPMNFYLDYNFLSTVSNIRAHYVPADDPASRNIAISVNGLSRSSGKERMSLNHEMMHYLTTNEGRNGPILPMQDRLDVMKEKGFVRYILNDDETILPMPNPRNLSDVMSYYTQGSSFYAISNRVVLYRYSDIAERFDKRLQARFPRIEFIPDVQGAKTHRDLNPDEEMAFAATIGGNDAVLKILQRSFLRSEGPVSKTKEGEPIFEVYTPSADPEDGFQIHYRVGEDGQTLFTKLEEAQNQAMKAPKQSVRIEKLESIPHDIIRAATAHDASSWHPDGIAGKRTFLLARDATGKPVGVAAYYENKRAGVINVDAIDTVGGKTRNVKLAIIKSLVAQSKNQYRSAIIKANPGIDLLRVQLFEDQVKFQNEIDFYKSLGFREDHFVSYVDPDQKRYYMTINASGAERLSKIRSVNEIEHGSQAMSAKSLSKTINPAQRAVSNTGGIDFTPPQMNLQTKNDGGDAQGIQFQINPAMLAEFKNSPGFTPIIIGIHPTDVKTFLGISSALH